MVHWDRKGARRRVMIQIGILLVLISIIALTYERKSSGLDRDAKPLQLLGKEILPLKEISGMAVLNEGGESQIVAIGDDKAKVFWLKTNVDQSFKELMVERFSLCQTEDFDECNKMIKKLTKNWEALAIDGAHKLFALQEHSQTIVVMNRELTAIEHVLHFNFGEAFSDAVAKGARKVRKNALGEGMILLKNGHVLIAKENFPVTLVEFGPEGQDALGLNPNTVLSEGESFAMSEPFHNRLVPLHSWTLATHGKCDISDLALDKDRQLLALSEDCLTIQRYKTLEVSQEPKLSEVYILPGEIQSPEGLVAVGDEWFVGSDVASKKHFNFYRLRAQSSLK
ncbi:MAG: hypothetical protein EOP10_21335 [Proteobacteria bacterium]|nr:MAG: hypothetical protein EOP10_21335 [Pseudomonadota bacterium]